jgi:uncharacterized protein YcbK (DUF882 family)
MASLSQHFHRIEFACGCGCGFDTVDAELIDVLEDIRVHFNNPIRITSACRCSSHNFDVGGTKSSKHKLGRAADIVVDGVSPDDVHEYIDMMWPDTYGLGHYQTFTHIDTRGHKARW